MPPSPPCPPPRALPISGLSQPKTNVTANPAKGSNDRIRSRVFKVTFLDSTRWSDVLLQANRSRYAHNRQAQHEFTEQNKKRRVEESAFATRLSMDKRKYQAHGNDE